MGSQYHKSITMKLIKIIIIDDEALARRRLRNLVEKDNRFLVIGEAESGDEGIEMIQDLNPDALLLDIELKDMTGFEMLKKVNPNSLDAIIFITAYDQYAIKAFDENAIDYLLKPFKTDRFYASLNRLYKVLESKNKEPISRIMNFLSDYELTSGHLKISEGKTAHYFDPGELIYIKSESYYCYFYTIDNHTMIRTSLKKIEDTMPSYFVRINRSVIININKISSTKRLKKSLEIKMKNDQEFTAYNNLDFLLEK